MSFLYIRLHLSRQLDGFRQVSSIRRLYRIVRIPLYRSGSGACIGVGMMMDSGLKTGNRFLLMKDRVTSVLHTCSAIRAFLLVYPKLSRSSELKLPEYYHSSRKYLNLFQQKQGINPRVIHYELETIARQDKRNMML